MLYTDVNKIILNKKSTEIIMKKLIVLLTISTLSTSAIAEETSWFDSLKNLVGLGDKTEQTAKLICLRAL